MNPRFAVLLAGVVGCRAEAATEQYSPGPVPTNPSTIPVAAVNGSILGRSFDLGTARYLVDRRPGYEKLEIQLLDHKLDRACGDTGRDHGTEVWLRRRGPDDAKPETVRFAIGEDSPWEAHYEVFQAGDWTGNGDASAIVVLAERKPDLELAGEIYVCFADKSQSCVSGRFAAVHCPIRIDALVRGTDAMERPSARKPKAP